WEEWLEQEYEISLNSILRNIGGYGYPDPSVPPGTPLASPSRHEPNYFYQWTRDSAVTLDTLIYHFNDTGATNSTLIQLIDDYIHVNYGLQRLDNPSGQFYSPHLSGLGEPKFYVNGTAFLDHWGRPQRDGPALRSIAIMRYLRICLETGENGNELKSVADLANLYYSVVSPDLHYVGLNWRKSGFDLWEELDGQHFFTSMVQMKSIADGIEIAEAFGDKAIQHILTSELADIKKFIAETYFDSEVGHLRESPGHSNSRTGLNSALFLASIKVAGLGIYEPYSDEVVASLFHYIQSMEYLYDINRQRLAAFEGAGVTDISLVGIAIGRYAEDIYDGVGFEFGNPWFVCTATVSHMLYLIVHHLSNQPEDFELEINALNRQFYGLFLANLVGKKYWTMDKSRLRRDAPEFTEMLKLMVKYGDSYLDVIREHHSKDGHMSEQFSRFDGYMRGASDLTWSYSAFRDTVRQRQ
ncbi:Six-hairpin glycosidase, partial [Nadsonia fulvescens var. elongata DSM 6958]